jgi:hypothetical protein
MEEECRPGSGRYLRLRSGQVYHQKAGIHALDKQLDTVAFFVLIE